MKYHYLSIKWENDKRMKKIMSMRVRMCNLYFRDAARNKGWEEQNIFLKSQNILETLTAHRTKIWAIINGKYNYLRQVELVLTTKCSLRCRDCANLMQYYEKPYDIEPKKVTAAFKKFVRYFDEINTVVLVGGEPLLSKNLTEIILFLADFHQVNHIHIFTNGTIIPHEKDICALKNAKVKIIISDYGKLSRNRDNLINWCKKNKVKYHLKSEDLEWGYIGDMQPRKRTPKMLQKQFRNCNNYCRSILNGKLFYCPRAAHSDDLGYVKESRDYVDLLSGKVSRSAIMNIVYSLTYFAACDYCNYGTKEMVPIKPGVQMQRSGKENIPKK